MKLICGKIYRVTVGLTRRRNWPFAGSYGTMMTVYLNYCGGSMEDKDGHYICGGSWIHQGQYNSTRNECHCHQFFDLPILSIVDDAEARKREVLALCEVASEKAAKRFGIDRADFRHE